jgi:aldose 1-epimerase
MPSDPQPPHWPATEPTEVRLTRGNASVAIDLRGGGLRRLTVGEWDVLEGYDAGTVPRGHRGGVLFPWPNRLRDGRWTWRGQDHQLEVASPSAPNAMHGLVCWQPWQVVSATEDSATVGTVLEARPGFPFRLAAALDYALGAERLAVTLRVRNLGSDTAPFGVGFHPYLHVGATEDGGLADAELTVPARTRMEVDAGLPTGAMHPFDGDVGRLGDRVFDDPLTDLVRDDDGWARLNLRGSQGAVELAVDGSWPWLQLYSADTLPEGQRRRSLAVEPMTCPPNALADGTDLVVLEPGGEWAGTWTLGWTAL